MRPPRPMIYYPPSSQELWRMFDMVRDRAIWWNSCDYCGARAGTPCVVRGTSRPAVAFHAIRQWVSEPFDRMRHVAVTAINAYEEVGR